MDFVVMWVDGNDPEWLDELDKYSNLVGDRRISRFRDWENLKYWFRGIEKFAPWVNKIHFITAGHYPKWLNLEHPKLNLVKHSDYIPEEYLPTFNSSVIEIFIHRIPGLSEEFILFNDDFFIINDISPSYFFRKGLPCDMFAFNLISNNDTIGHSHLNNVGTINQFFSKRKMMKEHFFKCFNFKYGLFNLRTLFLTMWPNFTGFIDPHLPAPFLKSTFEEVWERKAITSKNISRFRDNNNVTQYLMRYWQLVCGKFIPSNVFRDAVYYTIDNNNLSSVCACIENQLKSIIILNDCDDVDFDLAKNKIIESFEIILSNKSQFEN